MTTAVSKKKIRGRTASLNRFGAGTQAGFHIVLGIFALLCIIRFLFVIIISFTSEESIRELGSSTLSGRLLDSAEDMRAGRNMVSPLQDAMNNKAREVWLLECIPALAAGTMTPGECWQRVIEMNPFGK